MSTKENSGDVAVEKVTENDKPNADAKCEIKGIKRAAEVSKHHTLPTINHPPSQINFYPKKKKIIIFVTTWSTVLRFLLVARVHVAE